MIRHRQVQGLVVVGVFSPPFYALLQQVQLPWVSLDHFDEALPTDCITGSDEAASVNRQPGVMRRQRPAAVGEDRDAFAVFLQLRNEMVMFGP
jgi:hypothetical protein